MSNISDDMPQRADEALEAEAAKADDHLNGGLAESLREQVEGSGFSKISATVIAAIRPELREKVNDIPVEIEAVLGRTKVSVSELMRVDPGHRFRLNRRFGEPIELLVNGRLIGHGEIVADQEDNVIGIRMTRIAE